jgi:hypothetical protein
VNLGIMKKDFYSPRKARRIRRFKRMKFDELSNQVIHCAIEVHHVLGPGLLESTYELRTGIRRFIL